VPKKDKKSAKKKGEEPLLPDSHGVVGNPYFDGPPAFNEGHPPPEVDLYDDRGLHSIGSRDRPPPK